MIAVYAWYCRCFPGWSAAHGLFVEDTRNGDLLDVLAVLSPNPEGITS